MRWIEFLDGDMMTSLTVVVGVLPISFMSIVEVAVPFRVEGIRAALDEHVKPDRRVLREEDPEPPVLPSWCIDLTREHPLATVAHAEVLPCYPASAFLWMPSYRPSPERLPDHVVHVPEGGTAGSVPVVVGPAPYLGVQLSHQVAGLAVVSLDDLPDLFEEGEYRPLGRPRYVLAVVLPHRLAKEVESVLDVGDYCLGRREPKSTLSQEAFQERLDLISASAVDLSGRKP
jgi:hypothetical protein